MPKSPKKKSAVKAIILEYLKHLYEEQQNGQPLSAVDKLRISQKKELVSAVYALSNGRFVERGVSLGKRDGVTEVSPATINQAIDELLADNEIELKFGQYQYQPSEDEKVINFPILKVASEIPITPLPVQDYAFYKTNAKYAPWITDYINSQFLSGDIHAVSFGDVIMCLDLEIPKTSKSVEKRASLEQRMAYILKDFDLQSIREFDDDYGYDEKDVAKIAQKAEEKTARMQLKREETAQSYGGQITPRKRNIKKR